MNQFISDFASHDYPGFDEFLGAENAELMYVLQHKHEQFIYVQGEEGAGKSHLLQAWVAQALDVGRNALYIDAAATPLTEAALDAEYLVIGQIEKLNDKKRALLFAIFNRFRNSGKDFLLLSSEYTPQQLAIREDLRTRMAYCLVYEVRPLTDWGRIDALVSMTAARQVTIGPEILEYPLDHWRRDMDSLMQMFDTLDNYTVMMGKRITLPPLRQLLKQQKTQ